MQFSGICINVVLKRIIGSDNRSNPSAVAEKTSFVSRTSRFCFLNPFFTHYHHLPAWFLCLTPSHAWNPELLQETPLLGEAQLPLFIPQCELFPFKSITY